ncbi:MAG: hypothetical protein ACLFU0_07255 [Alphaproteobacteria bacterium]
MMRVVRWFLVLGGVGVAGFVAYESGRAQNQAELDRLGDQVAALEGEIIDAREEALTASERERAARERAHAIAERYQRDVPTGERRELLTLIDRRLEGGMPAERLRFVLAEVQAREACAEAVETKRFLLTTPVAVGRDNTVAFGDGRITVTGQGAAARDDDGRAEAWFDAAEPVSIRFLKLDGAVSLAEGTLPLTHRLVDGDREWRFQVRPHAERGFVEVTAQTCAFP